MSPAVEEYSRRSTPNDAELEAKANHQSEMSLGADYLFVSEEERWANNLRQINGEEFRGRIDQTNIKTGVTLKELSEKVRGSNKFVEKITKNEKEVGPEER